jgi:hypothetical protein
MRMFRQDEVVVVVLVEVLILLLLFLMFPLSFLRDCLFSFLFCSAFS